MVFLPGFRAVASLQGPKERSRNGIISLIGEYWKNVELPSQNMNFKITYKRKKVLDELKYWYYLLLSSESKMIKSKYVNRYKIAVMIKKNNFKTKPNSMKRNSSVHSN